MKFLSERAGVAPQKGRAGATGSRPRASRRPALWLIIPMAAAMNFVTDVDAQGQRCWRTPSGWVCQSQQQTNPVDGR